MYCSWPVAFHLRPFPEMWTILVAALPRRHLFPVCYHCWVGGHLFPPLPYVSPYGTDYPLEVYSLEQGQLPSDRCFLDVAYHMFLSREGVGGEIRETRELTIAPGGSGENAQTLSTINSATAERCPTPLLTARCCGGPQGPHSDKAPGGKTRVLIRCPGVPGGRCCDLCQKTERHFLALIVTTCDVRVVPLVTPRRRGLAKSPSSERSAYFASGILIYMTRVPRARCRAL